MFREMRRKKQKLSHEECIAVLERGISGVLAVLGDDEYPYAVPLNYVYADGRLYFHSARQGHKIDALKRHAKASFCVVDSDKLVPQEYTTYFRSVIVFGRVSVIEDDAKKRAAIQALARKYNPADSEHHRNAAIDREYAPLCMLEMETDHISGKEAIELVRQKSNAFRISPAQDEETLGRCLAVREDVFTKERGVPAEIERDEGDVLGGACEHFLIEKGGEPVGAFRCRRDGDAVVLQRFCVVAAYRRSGAGSEALRCAEEYYRKKGALRMELDSKCESEEFYKKNGYKTVSEPFEEAGILHVKMVKEL